MKHQLQSVEEKVRKECGDECIPRLDELFLCLSDTKPFSGLDTEYSQAKYFREKYDFSPN